jgi:hypothetical protein
LSALETEAPAIEGRSTPDLRNRMKKLGITRAAR